MVLRVPAGRAFYPIRECDWSVLTLRLPFENKDETRVLDKVISIGESCVVKGSLGLDI